MKLVVNTTALVPPLTGIGHYTAQLTSYLIASAQLHQIHGLSLSGVQLLETEELKAMLASLTADTDSSPSSAGRLHRLARRVPFARELRRFLVQQRFRQLRDTLSGYRYWEPNFLRLPLDMPSAVTVYDLSHIVYPQFHPPERVKLMESGLEASIQGADKVITISEFSRSEIARLFSVPLDNIEIVSPAVSDAFRSRCTAHVLQRVRDRYQLPEQFFLSVGTLEPRKNGLLLLKAYGRLPLALRKQYPLVMVGGKGWCSDEVEAEISRYEARGEVIRPGYVTQSDIPAIYQQASALAYVSLYEGYGMPVAEAMVSGTPVLTSDRSSMPEVGGSAALTVNPDDVDAITWGLERILLDDVLREKSVARGLQESENYRWSLSGRKLESVLSGLPV